MLFFVTVNQVLVRLWARVIAATPSECQWSRCSADLSDRELLFARVEWMTPQRLDSEGSEAR